MDKMNRINLLLTLDANYLPRLHVVLTSIRLTIRMRIFVSI